MRVLTGRSVELPGMGTDDPDKKSLDELEQGEMIHYEAGAKTIVRFKGRDENGDVRYEMLNGDIRTEDPETFIENSNLIL